MKLNKLYLVAIIIIITSVVGTTGALYFFAPEHSSNTQVSSSKPTGLVGDISIGTLLPLTGDLSTQGEEEKASIQMAADDFNDYLKKNNANWNLKIVYEDSATNPVIALEKLTSLNAKNIHLVIGPASSAELRNIMGYSNSNGMLIFSQSSTAPSLAINHDSVYRLTPDDSKQGPAIATLLVSNGIEVINQVVRADTWGDGLSSSIAESFVDKGGIVAQTIRYNPESPEFSVTTSLLAKAVNDQIAIHGAENIGVVMIGFSETLQFMQSSTGHEVLDDVLWFGTDANTKETKITNDPLGSEFANKVHFTTTLLSTADNDIRKDVESRLIQQIGRTPNTYAFSAYDIVWILGLAMIEADSNDVNNLTPIIREVASNYNGAVGNAKLNEAGDLDTSNYDVWGVRDKSWKLIGYYDSNMDSVIEIPNQVEQDIKNAVQQTIAQYDGELNSITNLQHGSYYSFVLSGDLDTILVHPKEEVIGEHPTGVNNANISVARIIELLGTEEGVWIDYYYPNPATDKIESKRSWLVLYDNYVFASGYYNPKIM